TYWWAAVARSVESGWSSAGTQPVAGLDAPAVDLLEIGVGGSCGGPVVDEFAATQSDHPVGVLPSQIHHVDVDQHGEVLFGVDAHQVPHDGVGRGRVQARHRF